MEDATEQDCLDILVKEQTMAQQTFTIQINPFVLQTAIAQGEQAGKSLNQLLATFVTAYANGESFTPMTLLSSETVTKQVTISLPDAILGRALHRLRQDGQSAEQIFVDMITVYAQDQVMMTQPETLLTAEQPTESEPPPTSSEPISNRESASAPIDEEEYGTLPIIGVPTDRPADQHGDINLALRGYAVSSASHNFIDLSGATDHRAPQLTGLFADNRLPTITATYRVHHWQWANPPNPGTRGPEITEWEATAVGLAVTPSEPIHVPTAGYDIGRGYQVMILYAATNQLTLVYTGEDTVAHGYVIHLVDVHPEPRLLDLYHTMNAQGRRELPALRAGQALGRAHHSEIKIAIRDTGRFMDPRSRKDWWR